jgi:hypothetical protein
LGVGDRQMSMSCRASTIAAIVACATAAIAGCGRATTPGGSALPTTATAASASRSATARGLQRYEVNAIVLSSPTHGSQLCAGGVASSLPPQCGGPPIAHWDWSTVTAKTALNGVTWGSYHLVGTFDGTTFSLTEPPASPIPAPATPMPDFSPPCPAPPGGWPQISTTLIAYQAFVAAAQSPADFAGMWVAQHSMPADSGRDVLTVAYTGDVERHRAELTAMWKGPVCVIQRPRSVAALQQAQDDLVRNVGQQLRLQVLSVSIDPLHSRLDVGVLVADAATQAALDQRFGAGAVLLTGTLKPVS